MSPVSTSVVENVPTTVFTALFSAIIAGESVMSVGAELLGGAEASSSRIITVVEPSPRPEPNAEAVNVTFVNPAALNPELSIASTVTLAVS